MKIGLIAFYFSLTLLCLANAGQVSHCAYGTTVKDLLKLAGISGGQLLSYVSKLKKHNIDQSVLASLTLKQLENIGITALGDRLKIFKFFSNDVNDCTSSTCKNNGVCRDGFRCFSCVCNPKHGYYGPNCGIQCPCKNGGLCKTIPTGFECVCPPGYSGDLCDTKFLTEDTWSKLEESLEKMKRRLAQSENQIKLQSARIQSLEDNCLSPRGTWRLHRANEVLNQLDKIELHQTTPTYTQKLPLVLPSSTQAILISVYCNFWNTNGHAYLDYVAYQKGNDKNSAKAQGYNTHYNVYANTFYYEQMIPWNKTLSNELIFKVTSSYRTGGSNNWYRARLVGYVTTE